MAERKRRNLMYGGSLEGISSSKSEYKGWLQKSIAEGKRQLSHGRKIKLKDVYDQIELDKHLDSVESNVHISQKRLGKILGSKPRSK